MELGQTFLSYYYGIKLGTKLSSSQVFKVRCVNVLNEFQQNKTFSKCHQPLGQQVPTQFISILDKYNQAQKNLELSVRTIQGKQIRIIHFLSFLEKRSLNDINTLVPYDVLASLETLSEYSNSTKSVMLFNLRDFLSFRFTQGYVESQLNQLFPVVISNKFERIPSYYSPEEIQMILLTVDRSTVIGRRDYIVLILAVQLKMRAGDIRL